MLTVKRTAESTFLTRKVKTKNHQSHPTIVLHMMTRNQLIMTASPDLRLAKIVKRFDLFLK